MAKCKALTISTVKGLLENVLHNLFTKRQDDKQTNKSTNGQTLTTK